MKAFWIVITLCTTLVLAACAPATAPGDTPPAAEATAVPAVEPTTAAADPTTVPAEEPAVPAEQAAGDNVDMGELVRQVLVQQLQIDAAQVEIVSVEPVDWPDSCLGISTPDVMCAQVITPGYRVVLAVGDQEYEYHTNADGANIQLAAAPEANIGDTLLIWQQTLDTCQAATFGATGVAFGPCMGEPMGGNYAGEERMAELGQIVVAFAPFQADTPAGIVTLNGQGEAEATPAQQRMIAEWARQAQLQATAGSAGAGDGLAFAWHREGGIAGFCDDLTASVTGQVYASNCRGETPETIAKRWLDSRELEQIYAWVDEYAPFEFEHKDNAMAADSMTTRLVYSGAGAMKADANIQQRMVDFAAELFANLAESP